VIRRLLSLPLLVWALGFALFVVALPQPADDQDTDAIVVLTGAPGRIERGLQILQSREAKRMLISGVNRSVRPHELAFAQRVPKELFDCCIDLGTEAVDTRSNAMETARWIARRRYRTVRLITTDWHMRRARFELSRALDADVEIVTDAVKSRAGFGILFKEYHKYLLSRLGSLVGL
jgi:uncharacterized SAM-binding protein YcdF (DUF218 family)